MIMTLSGPSLGNGRSKAGQIIDSALDALSGTRDMCCDYPPRACCWDDRSVKSGITKMTSSLRGVRSFGLLGPIDSVKAHPILLVGGLVLGAWLVGRKR